MQMQHAVEQRDVGAGLDGEVQVRFGRGGGAARIDHDGPERRGYVARAASMRRYRIGCAHAVFEPAMKSSVGVVDVLVACRRRVAAERLLVARHRARHAQPRIGVDVVGADEPLGELVEDVVVLGQQLAGHVERDAVGTVLADALRRTGRRPRRARRPTRRVRRTAFASRRSGCVRRAAIAVGDAVRCSVRPLLQSWPRLAG